MILRSRMLSDRTGPRIRNSNSPNRRGDLAGGADRQRTNVLILDRKRERPFLSENRELLPGLLGAAFALDPI
jgi:hypothetical protein